MHFHERLLVVIIFLMAQAREARLSSPMKHERILLSFRTPCDVFISFFCNCESHDMLKCW